MNTINLDLLVNEWQPRLEQISEQDSGTRIGSKWNRKQVLGHLIDSAANNHQRFVRLQQGDLAGFPGYEQEIWVTAGDYDRNSWRNLVALWSQYNRQLGIVIENIAPDCMTNMWIDEAVDLEFLIKDYERHLLHHLKQLECSQS